MRALTHDQLQIVAMYDQGTRRATVQNLRLERSYMDPGPWYNMLTRVMEKLQAMTDAQYEALDRCPDFS